MRKFILISALLLTSVSAQAGDTRSLSLAGIPTATTAAEAPKRGLFMQVAARHDGDGFPALMQRAFSGY